MPELEAALSEKTSSGFCMSIKMDLFERMTGQNKKITELSEKVLNILEDIYAKHHGRRNSNAYKDAAFEFWHIIDGAEENGNN